MDREEEGETFELHFEWHGRTVATLAQLAYCVACDTQGLTTSGVLCPICHGAKAYFRLPNPAMTLLAATTLKH